MPRFSASALIDSAVGRPPGALGADLRVADDELLAAARPATRAAGLDGRRRRTGTGLAGLLALAADHRKQHHRRKRPSRCSCHRPFSKEFVCLVGIPSSGPPAVNLRRAAMGPNLYNSGGTP